MLSLVNGSALQTQPVSFGPSQKQSIDLNELFGELSISDFNRSAVLIQSDGPLTGFYCYDTPADYLCYPLLGPEQIQDDFILPHIASGDGWWTGINTEPVRQCVHSGSDPAIRSKWQSAGIGCPIANPDPLEKGGFYDRRIVPIDRSQDRLYKNQDVERFGSDRHLRHRQSRLQYAQRQHSAVADRFAQLANKKTFGIYLGFVSCSLLFFHYVAAYDGLFAACAFSTAPVYPG